jgi:HSP20 family protein
MNLKKLIPWNWFKHEEGRGQQEVIPVQKEQSSSMPVATGLSPMLQLHREIDRLFEQAFAGFGRMPSLFSDSAHWLNSWQQGMFQPQIDIAGDDEAYNIKLEVPGLTKDDIKVEVRDDLLVISGEKKDESESRDKHYYRVERSYGQFQRTLNLPQDANVDDMRASLKDGVLSLYIPRKEVENDSAKRIEIN